MRTPTIVVGVDGSAESRGAAAWTAEEAARRGWAVTLLHADLPRVDARPDPIRLPPRTDLSRTAREFVAAEAEALFCPGIPSWKSRHRAQRMRRCPR